MVGNKLTGVKHPYGQNMGRADSDGAGHYSNMPYAPEHIAELIRSHCKANKVSIRSLAKDMDVRHGTILSFLRGDTKSMRLDTAYKLAKAMDLNIWELLGESPPGTEEAQELIRRLHDLFRALRELRAARANADRDMEALEAELTQIESELGASGDQPLLLLAPSRSAQRFP